MAIRFQCGACGAGFKAAETQAGQELPCPKCGSTIRVPVSHVTLAPPDDPLDETESAGLAETQVNPLAGVAKKVAGKKGQTPPPPPPPIAPKPREEPEPNAFQSPTSGYESPRDLDLTKVTITDIDLSFWAIFKLVFKFWVVGLAFALALWLLFFLLAVVMRIGFYSIGP